MVKSSGMTQADMARAAGITQKHLSMIMTGAEMGSLEVWDRLLKVAGVEVRGD